MFEKIVFSLTVMILGMLIVFFGLTLLIICIKGLSALINALQKKEDQPAAESAPVVVPEPVAETAAAQTGADANELIAVITAALNAYMASENPGSNGKSLVVRNIRAAKANAWARAGRAEQLGNRF